MAFFKQLEAESESDKLISIYKEWLDFVKTQKSVGYFIVSNDIEEYLPFIKSPAINLYLFYAAHAKNGKGFSFYSIDKLAEKLKVTPKTINNWNATLSDLGLIFRSPNSYHSSRTQLLPTTNFLIDPKKNITSSEMVINTLTNDLGYKVQTKISILSLNGNTSTLKSYQLYKRTYAIQKKGEINRYVAMLLNEEKISEKIKKPSSSWMYYSTQDHDNDLNLITDTNKLTDKDIIELLIDLEDKEQIRKYKEAFDEYQFNLT